MAGEGGSSTITDTINLANILRSNDEDLNEEFRLQSVSAKNSGKKEADEVLSLHYRLIAERDAALTQFTNIIKESAHIREDIRDGEPTSSSLVSGQVEQLAKYKTNAIECVDAIMATVCHLNQAIKVFQDKRYTSDFHEDCDIYSRNANHLLETGKLKIRKMHKRMDSTLKEVVEAKETIRMPLT